MDDNIKGSGMIRPFFRSAANLLKLAPSKRLNFLNSFDNVITDCDGVLWIIRDAISGSPEAISNLRTLGKRVFFVTNNDVFERNHFVEKASEIGYPINRDEVFTPGRFIASYLKDVQFNGKAYVVGMEGLADELRTYDKIQPVEEIGPDVVTTPLFETILSFEIEDDVKAVIFGMDQHFSYNKMLKASTYLADPECLFLASCTDKRYPMIGKIVPGTGALLSTVEIAAERKATILGKPSSLIGRLLEKEYDVKPSRTLIIGDSLRSDILLGSRCGYHTLLVLSGETSLEDIARLKDDKENHELLPDFYLDTLGEINEIL